ncbi:MAG: histidine phosphatase family protein [Patescibacteria group bacterium]|nr:histidine phosphatase family protein [Patescibacteria group bacterium]
MTHCETCYNRRGIFTGRIDSSLTPSGDRHAKDLALKLKDKLIAHAYTSHLSRAKQTLHHILKYHPETEVHVDDRIIERDYGRLSRKSKAKYEIQYPDLYPIYHRSYDVPPPGGESIKQVEKRVIPFLKEVIRTMGRENSNALIVAHGNSIRPIIRYFEQLSPEEMMKLENLRHKIYEYMI